MTKFQERLKLILADKFEFSREEKEKIYKINSLGDEFEEENISEAQDKYTSQKKYLQKMKNNEEFKRKQKEYMQRYYREVRCGGKPPRERTTSVELRERVKKFNSKPCIYEGKEIKFGTLVSRLHNKMGLSFHDANIEAKKYLKETE
jgi:uncharacterized membrane protein YcgQ (UPF0703/DUF1980 family)